MSGKATAINVRYPLERYIWRGINYLWRAPLQPAFKHYILLEMLLDHFGVARRREQHRWE